MPRIQVRRELLIGLAAALAASLLALAYLLGRESGRPQPAPASAGPTAAPAPAEPVPEPAPRAPLPAPALAGAPAPAPPAPARAMPASPAAGVDPVRAAVAAYLEAVDRIQPGQLAGDPEALARGILEGLAKGDTRGLDDLVRQSGTARAGLAALTPPAPCMDLHRESLASLDESLEVIRAIRTSVAGGAAQPLDITAQAERLRARAERLQAEEKALRQRYGLPR